MSEQGDVRLAGVPVGVSVAEPTADDIALILHTSGSTGRPKRVPLRHFNLAVSSANYRQHLRSYRRGRFPLHHAALPCLWVNWLDDGDSAFRGDRSRSHQVQALSFWRTVKEHRVTWYSGVPTMHQLLLARTHHKPAEAASRWQSTNVQRRSIW